MADGDLVALDQHRLAIKLLDAHNAASAGPWMEVPPRYGVRSFWVDTFGGTDAINIEVSNAISTPSGTTSGVVARTLNSTTPAATGIEVYRWVRAVKAGTAGTSTCVLEAGKVK